MTPDFTREYALQLGAAIQHAIAAHQLHPHTPRAAIRYWDERTPFVIHPIWCAMTLLHEPLLPATIRFPGALALLWHDVLEDTLLPLPPDADARVRELVAGMTFTSFTEERATLWERSEDVQLLKLYDKTSQFFDAVSLSDAKRATLAAHTLRLCDLAVERYGVLNIVRIARVYCAPETPQSSML